jgi:archaellum component FlaC
LVCIKEDVNKQLEFAKEKLERLMKEKEDLSEKLNTLTDQLLFTSDKLFDANNLINQYKGLLSEKDEVT